jgi:hypothetical protein
MRQSQCDRRNVRIIDVFGPQRTFSQQGQSVCNGDISDFRHSLAIRTGGR